MELRTKRAFNWIIATIVVLIMAVMVGVFFDYYYDLNDDVLIKDILSGTYSGIPESRNIQMQFLLSALFSGLYRIMPSLPWYGGFLYLCQYGAVVIIIACTLKMLNLGRLSRMLVVAIAEGALLVGIMLPHMVNVQYTITVAFMSAAASVLIMSNDAADTLTGFLVQNIPVILIIFVSYLLRSEMLLLMLPFVGLAWVYRFFEEKNAFSGTRVMQYVSVFAITLLTIVLGHLSNSIAYSTDGWKGFCELFDARTQLYDFEIIPSYEGNEEFYDSIGIDSSSQKLLENYNYGLNPNINGDKIQAIADYAHANRKATVNTLDKLKTKVRLYLYEISHGKNSTGSDYPFNVVTGCLYIWIVVGMINHKRILDLWKLILLVGGRSVIWLYILMGDRAPDRITHSLYLIEIVLLLGLVSQYRTAIGDRVLLGLGLGLAIIILVDNIAILEDNQKLREEINSDYLALYEYTNNNANQLYLMDVYSTVVYSEKMFGPNSNINKSNTELLGGWFYGSPAESMKLRKFGYSSMEEALTNGALMVMRTDLDGMDDSFITDYYASQGQDVQLVSLDKISSVFEIYGIQQ